MSEMVGRTKYTIIADTGGDFVDTGPSVNGAVLQVHADMTSFDTGATLKLSSVATGMVIADFGHVGGGSFTRAPKVLTFDTGGAEIGNQSPVLASEKVRLEMAADTGDVGQIGTVYVYSGW